MPLTEDTVLENRYRIDGLLARGGMGAIYRAFDTNLKTPVAIKENAFTTPERVAQFKQEALILARLRHSALPRVIHHFSAKGNQYLVMDFIEGENLWEIVERQEQPLAENVALDYTIQVCGAVSYLHKQQPPIIHRDIKPQNIKITPQGQAVLVDFGIAKQAFDENSATQAGAQGVTPGFSPPEQYRQRQTTPLSDIYSLGATLYAILTGQKPPDSITLMAGKRKFKPPDKLNDKLSPQISGAVTHAMQVEPTNRPQSVAAWQKELEAIVGSVDSLEGDKDPTLVPEGPAKTPASAAAAISPESAGVAYWLVDAAGLGYPIGSKTLTIGRDPAVDIVLENLSVSRAHARLRVSGGRCLVLDNKSGNGTFINDRRLGTEWYPLNPGDMLSVGSARFYLTSTQPARLASDKIRATPTGKTGPMGEESTVVAPVPAAPTAAVEGSKKRGRLWLVLVLLLVGLVGLAGYWLIDSTLLTGLTGAATDLVNATPTAVAEPSEATVVQVAQNTPPDQPTMTPTLASLLGQVSPVDPTALASRGTATATSTPRVGTGNRDTLVRTPTRGSRTVTATVTLTATPTITSTRTEPIVTGPTVIPLEFDTSVTKLGSQEVIDVDLNPKNPREVYALVKGDGIYRSSNGGDGPWARLKLDGRGLVALAIDPSNPTRLYGPTWNAILKSTDGGNTWDAKTNGLVANRSVDLLVVHPTRPDTLYGGVGENLVVSIDGGESWRSQEYGAGLRVGRVFNIVIDPFDPDLIYVGGFGAAVYKSEDGGRSFIPMPYNTGEGTYGLAAHPTQPDVYLAGVNSAQAGIIRTNNGWDFEPVSTGLIYGGADSAYSAIAYAPSNPRIVYAGSGYESNPDAKGIFKSTDGGTTWSRINIGLATNPDTGFPYYVKSIVVHPTNPDIVFAATGSGLYQSVDGGVNWVLK